MAGGKIDGWLLRAQLRGAAPHGVHTPSPTSPPRSPAPPPSAAIGSPSPARRRPELVDRLAHTAAFGATPEVKGTARWVILHLAAHAGVRFASIHDLYIAMGRGEAGGFTVPAINVRMMAYDTGRAVMRAAKGLDAGAFILEIARSEIGYTEQRPHEYAAIMAAAALREGFRGPLFLQGDHVQVSAQEVRLARPRQGARHAARADPRGDRRRLLQHRHRHLDAGRSRQADAGRAAGGELRAGGRLHGLHPPPRARGRDRVGGRRDRRGRRQELRRPRAARLHAGLQRARWRPRARASSASARSACRPAPRTAASSAPTARSQSDVKIDLETLEELSRVARESTGWAAPCSTAPPRSAPRPSTRSRGWAPARSTSPPTSRTWSTTTRRSRPALKDEMYAWVREHAQEEKKANDTDEQFLYKARKKAIGPFKAQAVEPAGRRARDHRQDARGSVRVPDGQAAHRRHVGGGRQVRHAGHRRCRRSRTPRQAAAGKITSEERKAEGLAD